MYFYSRRCDEFGKIIFIAFGLLFHGNPLTAIPLNILLSLRPLVEGLEERDGALPISLRHAFQDIPDPFVAGLRLTVSIAQPVLFKPTSRWVA